MDTLKHSPLACSRLAEIQKNLALPQTRLKQDVVTRWNSTLYMLQSIQQQKMALGAYSAQHDIPQLTANQFDLINKLINILTPIEDITQSISSEGSSLSIVIPFVRALRNHLENNDDNDRGVRTMKHEMLKSLNTRFQEVETNELLVLATILDPCFKDKFFSGLTNRMNAKATLIAKLEEIVDTHQQENVTASTEEPVSKRQKTVLVQCLTNILEEDHGLTVESPESTSTRTAVENYLAEPLVHFNTGNANTYWRENQKRYSYMSELALRYLSAPSTSVQSERLFSSAGCIYSERRNRLSSERAEVLLFIKSNFDLINGTYDYKL